MSRRLLLPIATLLLLFSSANAQAALDNSSYQAVRALFTDVLISLQEQNSVHPSVCFQVEGPTTGVYPLLQKQCYSVFVTNKNISRVRDCENRALSKFRKCVSKPVTRLYQRQRAYLNLSQQGNRLFPAGQCRHTLFHPNKIARQYLKTITKVKRQIQKGRSPEIISLSFNRYLVSLGKGEQSGLPERIARLDTYCQPSA